MLDMFKNVAVAMTLYNPLEEDIQNLINYAAEFKGIYVYANSSIKEFRKKLTVSNIKVIGKGDNDGLAIACHALCTAAQKDGYKYVLLLDQDSRIGFKDINLLYENLYLNNDNVVMTCPQIVLNNKKPQSGSDAEFVPWCITSGSLLDLRYYGDDICFDEKYFIDRLDLDFCRQITEKGYKIFRINEALLYQDLGQTIIKRNKAVYVHAPLRHYYISRNRLYYNKKYHISGMITLAQFFRHIFMIIFDEDRKIEKLKMVFNGIADYKNNKFGKREF